MKFHFYIKTLLSSALSLFLFFSATMIDCTTGREYYKTSKEEIITDNKDISSETGVYTYRGSTICGRNY